jgi:hypothetical protein
MQNKKKASILENKPEGYPLYPVSEDIFHKNLLEKDIDPEDISKLKFPNEITISGKSSGKGLANDNPGSDFDIPGSELDDVQENIGSEDEENNYYSLGGDDHNNLDEDKTEL